MHLFEHTLYSFWFPQAPYHVTFNILTRTTAYSKSNTRFHSILTRFLQNGYSFSYKSLTASYYQVPNNGRYLILVAARSGLDLPNWPEPSGANPPPTVRDVIADLAFKNNRGEMGKMSTDVTGYVSFKHMPPQEGIYTVGFSGSSGQKRDGIHNYLTGYKPFPLELFSSDSIKVDFGQPAKKIKVLPNEKWACIHPERQDVLTVRELARLMSYPDSFVFQGKLKDQYKLVGSSSVRGMHASTHPDLGLKLVMLYLSHLRHKPIIIHLYFA